VVDVAVVRLHAEHPQVGVRRLEVGDRGVVVLLAELLEDGEAPAVPRFLGGLGVEMCLQRGEEAGEFGEDGGGPQPRGALFVADGVSEQPQTARAGRGFGHPDLLGGDRPAARREDDFVEFEVGRPPVAEAGERQPVLLGDPLGDGAEEDRGQPFPFQAAELPLADGGEAVGDHPPGGQDDTGAGRHRLGRQLHRVVGLAHDEHVLVDELSREPVDLDPVREGGVDRRRPIRVPDVGAVRHHAGPGQVGGLGGDDLEVLIDEVDRLHGLAEADVELMLADQLRVGDRRRRLQDPDPPEPALLGGDGHRQPTGVPAHHDEVVGALTTCTSRHALPRIAEQETKG
jgi:hypothetical protein